MSNYLNWLQQWWNYSSSISVNPHLFHQCASGSSIDGQCRSGSSFMTKICRILLKYKKMLFSHQKLQYIYPSASGPPWRTSKLQENGLQYSKDSIQYFKIIRMRYISFGSFLSTWIRIRLQPTKINADPCGSVFTTLVSSGNKVTCTVFYRRHGAGSLGRPLWSRPGSSALLR